MGIRYYAYPVAPEFIDRAREEPRAFLSADPLADAWGLDGTERPTMLYLDKCWRELQFLTAPVAEEAPRAAYRLFEGRVTMVPEGWIPWTRVLDPIEVADVARDLVLVGDTDIENALESLADPNRPLEEERSYITQYLQDATEFVSQLASDHWGLVYMIG